MKTVNQILSLLALTMLFGLTSCDKDNSLDNEILLNDNEDIIEVKGGDDEPEGDELSEYPLDLVINNLISFQNSTAEIVVMTGLGSGLDEAFGDIEFTESRVVQASNHNMEGEGILKLGNLGEVRFISKGQNVPILVTVDQPTFTYTFEIIGGTGRFFDAEGTATVQVKDNPDAQMSEVLKIQGLIKTTF